MAAKSFASSNSKKRFYAEAEISKLVQLTFSPSLSNEIDGGEKKILNAFQYSERAEINFNYGFHPLLQL